MKFRELFWAHVVHKENKWMGIGAVLLILLGVIAHMTGESVDLRFQTIGMPIFFLGVLLSNSITYALADVSPNSHNRGHEFYWDGNWKQYILISVVPILLILASMWLFLDMRFVWYFICPYSLFILFDFGRRFWRLKYNPKSHFRGHEHHSSKTIR